MPKFGLTILLIIVAAQGGMAATPPGSTTPSAASVQALIEASGIHSILDKATSQYQITIKASMHKALEGKTLNADQQKIESDAEDKMVALMSQLMSWDTLEPIVADVYTSTYTQDEVNGLTKFYSSPLGKTMINKQPQVMDKTMAEIQSKVQSLVPALKQLQMDTAQQLRAANTPGTNGSATTNAPAGTAPTP
jgi:hypothetical protein